MSLLPERNRLYSQHSRPVDWPARFGSNATSTRTPEAHPAQPWLERLDRSPGVGGGRRRRGGGLLARRARRRRALRGLPAPTPAGRRILRLVADRIRRCCGSAGTGARSRSGPIPALPSPARPRPSRVVPRRRRARPPPGGGRRAGTRRRSPDRARPPAATAFPDPVRDALRTRFAAVRTASAGTALPRAGNREDKPCTDPNSLLF